MINLPKIKKKLKQNYITNKFFLKIKRIKIIFSNLISDKSIKPGSNYNWIFNYINEYNKSSLNIIEVGSRDALDALSLSLKLNPEKCFIFEPTRVGITNCCNNISKYNGKVDFVLLPFAAHNAQNGIQLLEFREFIYGKNHGASSLYKWHTNYHSELDDDKGIELEKQTEILYKVPSCSLDSLDFLFEKKIFLLAMDVEGAEFEVLNGAVKLLKKIKYICLETGFNQPREGVPRDSAEKIVKFLKEKGFNLVAVDNGDSSLPKDDGQLKQFNILFQNKDFLEDTYS